MRRLPFFWALAICLQTASPSPAWASAITPTAGWYDGSGPLGTVDSDSRVQPVASDGIAAQAWWNCDPAGPLQFDDVVVTLLARLLTDGTPPSADPLAYWTDESIWRPVARHVAGTLSTDWGAGDSNTPIFTDYPLVLGYSVNDKDYLGLTGATTAAGALLASTDVTLDDALSPVLNSRSIVLMGAGLVGLAALFHRRVRF